MNRMTIKEVADHFKTSKNTIKYRMKKLPPDQVVREGDLIYILEDGINVLAKGFKKEEPAEPVEQPAPEPDKTTTELIRILTEQLEKKDKLIEDQTITIHRLEESLRIEQMRSANLIKLEADQKPKGLLSFFKRKREPAGA